MYMKKSRLIYSVSKPTSTKTTSRQTKFLKNADSNLSARTITRVITKTLILTTIFIVILFEQGISQKKKHKKACVFFGGEPAKMVEPELKEKECFACFICFSSCKI